MIIGNRGFEVTITGQFFKSNNIIGVHCVLVFRSIILFSNFLFKRLELHKITVVKTF